MMSSIRKTFLAFILAFGAKSSFGSSSSSSSHRDAVLCPLDNYYIDDADQPVREYYECPGYDDPDDFKRCCPEDGQDKCCQLKHLDSILGVDLKIAMIISLSVIVLCVISGFILIICCFAHPCPLYDTCSGSWDKDQTTISPGMVLTFPNEEEVEIQQLLATKDTNGKVNHVIVREDGKTVDQAEPV